MGEAVESLPFVPTTARCAADAKEQHEQRKQSLFIQRGKQCAFHLGLQGKQCTDQQEPQWRIKIFN